MSIMCTYITLCMLLLAWWCYGWDTRLVITDQAVTALIRDLAVPGLTPSLISFMYRAMVFRGTQILTPRRGIRHLPRNLLPPRKYAELIFFATFTILHLIQGFSGSFLIFTIYITIKSSRCKLTLMILNDMMCVNDILCHCGRLWTPCKV